MRPIVEQFKEEQSKNEKIVVKKTHIGYNKGKRQLYESRWVLQASHLLYIYAAVKAWNKGYRKYSSLLAFMIFVSLLNHREESKHGYTPHSDALEWFEKTIVLITFTAGAVQFRGSIDLASWVLLLVSALFFLVGHTSYYSGEMRAYTAAHTLWHLGTGYALLKVISNAPPASELATTE